LITVEGMRGKALFVLTAACWVAGAFEPGAVIASRAIPPAEAPSPNASFWGAGVAAAAPLLEPLLEPLHPATPDAATRTAVIAPTVLNRIVPPPIVGNQTGDRGGRFRGPA
jgi:hypothetical protein